MNSRLVTVEERQEILDRVQTALVIGKYPTSLNDPLMKDLQRLVRDAEERIVMKRINELK